MSDSPIKVRRKVWEEFMQCPDCQSDLYRMYSEDQKGMKEAYRCQCSLWIRSYNFITGSYAWERTPHATGS